MLNVKSGCFPSKLFKEIVTLGFNGNWYLTGEGSMLLLENSISVDPKAKYYEEIGKLFEAQMNMLSEIGSIRDKESQKELKDFE